MSNEPTEAFKKDAPFSNQLPADMPNRFPEFLPPLHALESPSVVTASNPISIAVDPIALITTECITITSAMRKHSRWAQSSVSAILGGAGGRLQEKDQSRPSSRGSVVGDRPRAPTIAAPGSLPVNGEGDATLAGRWGLRGKKGKILQDNPLLGAFSELRSDLAVCKDIKIFDAPTLLHPFLQVIRSSSTSAPITSLAVISITKFFSYNLITIESPRIAVAMQLLSAAITHCRFEASDTAADEIVLLRILKLMENMLARPEGQLLGDESVCEMMETGLSMCCQARLSEILRRSAEMAMFTMCQVVFSRLKTLSVEIPAARSRSNTTILQQASESVKMEPSVDGNTVVSNNETSMGLDTLSIKDHRSLEAEPNVAQPEVEKAPTSPQGGDLLADPKPYSMPSIHELFRVLIDLLDPHSRQHTDVMRIMALRIIDVALEVAGPSIAKHPGLAQLAKDNLCRHLFQLVRSENMALLNGSLRVAGTLLATCREILKLQQELFLSYVVACLHPRVDIPQEPGIDPALYEGVPQAPKLSKPAASQTASGRSTPVPVKDRQKLGLEGGTRRPEAREAMVESLGTLVRIPSFMAELFINYDCDSDRADLCEDMVGLLSRNAFPDVALWSTTSVPPLCLDSLLGFVQSMAERLDHDPPFMDELELARLRDQRTRKKIIVRGTSRFNEDPKAGIAYLVTHGVIGNADDPLQVARFMKGTTRISKKVLGDFISKKKNESILTAFIALFDFDAKRIDEALRDLLGSFRLPGESQLIERIVTVFTEKYCASDVPDGVADQDAAFVLTYAIIMLNTDLYNRNLKSSSRMTCPDFAKNLRGVNAGKDFAPEYLQGIYDGIKENEIILPDEHDNKHAFDFAWQELLMKTEHSGKLSLCDTNAFDADMFNAVWKPIVATLCYVFMSASDDAVYSRVVIGFNHCAQIAAKYGLVEAFDRIVYSLSTISTLATDKPSNTSLNTEVQAGKKSVMVSELAVKFGREFRAQLATVVLFHILSENEAVVNESWPYVIRIFMNLFVNSLITFPGPETSGIPDLPPIPLQSPSHVIDRDSRMNESGILSAFTSYLSSYAADDPPEPSDEELDNTLSTVDCIKACQPDHILANVLSLPASRVKPIVISLLSLLPEETSPLVIVKPERSVPVSGRLNGQGQSHARPAYNPSAVYLLELATSLTIRDSDTIAVAGEVLTASLQTLIRDASNLHPIATARIVHYLLELLRVSYEHDFMRAPVVLHAISSFDDNTLNHAAASVITGLAKCVHGSEPLRNEVTNSPDFWSILHRLHQHKDEAERVFNILLNIGSVQPPAVTADNYESAIDLANDFATAGSVGSIQAQRREMAARRGRVVKQAKPEETSAVKRAVKAVGIVYHLTNRIPDLIEQSHLERNEAWAAYWSPIFRALCAQCVNPSREIRHQSMSALQRALMLETLASEDHTEWVAIFGEVLFPLILRLLKPEIYQLDPLGMSETRIQAATLLCRIFLRYLDQLSQWEGMLDLWLRILDILDRMMNSGQSDALQEAVPESLKNILLVMSGGGYLTPPEENPSNEKVWLETKQRLDRFLPHLFSEVFSERRPTSQDEAPAVQSSAMVGSQQDGGKKAPAPATAQV